MTEDTMLTPFAVLKNQVKVNLSKVSIDNLVFRLHYRWTFVILVLSSILVCSREYIGEHIKCIADKGLEVKVVDRFCFFTSTFTVVKHFNETLLQEGHIPHPGVGPSADSDEVKHHAYYQWVQFVLFGQAIMFYIPHYIWKKCEGGRIKQLVEGLHEAAMFYTEEDVTVDGKTFPSKKNIEEKVSIIRRDFILRLHATRTWSSYLIMCEVLNLFHLIAQVFLTNAFLGGQFFSLGPNVMHTTVWDGMLDPLDVIFPKVTKCKFHKYGPSGSIQNHDILCVMALNVINEKIFTFLWFWYAILLVVTTLGLIWRLITFILHSRSVGFSEFVFSQASPGRLHLKNVISVTNECYFADWLFLYYLAKNLDGYVFKDLFISLAEDLDRQADERSQGNKTPSYYNGRDSPDLKARAISIPMSKDDEDKDSSIISFDEGTDKLLPRDDDDKTDLFKSKHL